MLAEMGFAGLLVRGSAGSPDGLRPGRADSTGPAQPHQCKATGAMLLPSLGFTDSPKHICDSENLTLDTELPAGTRSEGLEQL